jgi:hypothetical protein
MQRDLQTADGDNHNACCDQKLAQTGRPALLRFAHIIVGAVSRPPSAPRTGTRFVIPGRKRSRLGGATRRGDKILFI